MDDFLYWSMIAFCGAGLFAGSGGLLMLGLDWWIKNKKRWRLIMDAYAEGLRDGKAMKQTEDHTND